MDNRTNVFKHLRWNYDSRAKVIRIDCDEQSARWLADHLPPTDGGTMQLQRAIDDLTALDGVAK